MQTVAPLAFLETEACIWLTLEGLQKVPPPKLRRFFRKHHCQNEELSSVIIMVTTALIRRYTSKARLSLLKDREAHAFHRWIRPTMELALPSVLGMFSDEGGVA